MKNSWLLHFQNVKVYIMPMLSFSQLSIQCQKVEACLQCHKAKKKRKSLASLVIER